MTTNEIKKEIKRIKKELNSAAGLTAVILQEQLETLLFLKSYKSA